MRLRLANLLAWIVGLPLAVVLVVFAVANRHVVRLELWPLPFSLDVPVFLAVLAALAAGLLVGVLAMLPAAMGARLRLGQERRRAAALDQQLEVARLKAEQPALPTPPEPKP